MKWLKRLTAIVCVLTMLAFVGYTSVKAEPIEQNTSLEGYELQGLGRMQADIDGSGEFGDNPEDFIYDADDLVAFDNLVKNGKTAISAVINSYQTGDVLTLDTFANFSSAIDSLSTFPSGKYYYDSTTGTDDVTTLLRYIKEGESYYLCDQYGNKTSDEAQTVTESNLVEYKGLTQENLSAGYAGMVDKTFVLGNGSDNVTYWNLGYSNGFSTGYTEGYSDGQNNAGEIVYTYHTHGDGYCNEIPIYHAHNGNTASGGSCYSPRYCGGRKLDEDEDTGYAQCTSCGGWTYGGGGTCPIVKGYTLSCGKTTETVESYICGRNEGDILSATIKFTE